jgi:hypothetical protein
VFAPVAVIMTYERIEEAIDIANSTPYGLGASVFGTDQDECYKVAQKIDCGMVAINDFAVFYVSFHDVCNLHVLTSLHTVEVSWKQRWPALLELTSSAARTFPLAAPSAVAMVDSEGLRACAL